MTEQEQKEQLAEILEREGGLPHWLGMKLAQAIIDAGYIKKPELKLISDEEILNAYTGLPLSADGYNHYKITLKSEMVRLKRCLQAQLDADNERKG